MWSVEWGDDGLRVRNMLFSGGLNSKIRGVFVISNISVNFATAGRYAEVRSGFVWRVADIFLKRLLRSFLTHRNLVNSIVAKNVANSRCLVDMFIQAVACAGAQVMVMYSYSA